MCSEKEKRVPYADVLRGQLLDVVARANQL